MSKLREQASPKTRASEAEPSHPVSVLRLARVEANVDLKNQDRGFLEGRLQEQGVLGASAATPSNNRLL